MYVLCVCCVVSYIICVFYKRTRSCLNACVMLTFCCDLIDPLEYGANMGCCTNPQAMNIYSSVLGENHKETVCVMRSLDLMAR